MVSVSLMGQGAGQEGGWLVTQPPEGGDAMRNTLHIGAYTVAIVIKRRNRHSAK